MPAWLRRRRVRTHAVSVRSPVPTASNSDSGKGPESNRSASVERPRNPHLQESSGERQVSSRPRPHRTPLARATRLHTCKPSRRQVDRAPSWPGGKEQLSQKESVHKEPASSVESETPKTAPKGTNQPASSAPTLPAGPCVHPLPSDAPNAPAAAAAPCALSRGCSKHRASQTPESVVERARRGWQIRTRRLRTGRGLGGAVRGGRDGPIESCPRR